MNERLKELRLNQGLSQEEFGNKLNLSISTISKYEKGQRPINARTITQICNVFNVNESWLKNGTGDMYKKIDLDISYMMGKVFADDDDFLKNVFLTFAKLNDSERAVIKKVIDNLANKKN